MNETLRAFYLLDEEGTVIPFDTLEAALKLLWWCEDLACTVTLVEV